MEKPKEQVANEDGFLEKLDERELVELMALSSSPQFAILLSVAKNYIELKKEQAFDISPKSDIAVEHYGARQEIKKFYKFISGLNGFCQKRLKEIKS